MTVGELVKELLELDQSLPVLTSRDEEGNGYNALHGVYTGYYAESLDRSEYIEIVHQEDIDDERALFDEDSDDWYDDYSSYDKEVVVLG